VSSIQFVFDIVRRALSLCLLCLYVCCLKLTIVVLVFVRRRARLLREDTEVFIDQVSALRRLVSNAQLTSGSDSLLRNCTEIAIFVCRAIGFIFSVFILVFYTETQYNIRGWLVSILVPPPKTALEEL